MSDDSPGSTDWRHARRSQLFDVARGSRREVGFGWLDDSGQDDPSHDRELWVNARMTYVFALAAALGEDDGTLAAHGVRALATVFHDDEHGGWFDAVTDDGTPVDTAPDSGATDTAPDSGATDTAPDSGATDTGKRCYGHSFVLLAAAAAHAVGVEGADDLLDEARRVHDEHFFDPAAGRCVEERSRDWSRVDDYRGANSNMHAVEAYLVTADVTGEAVWRERAEAIAERIIGVDARAHDWRVPEHYDADWNVDLDLNRDRPDDPFRPFGATPGHAFEWARLLVQLDAAMDDGRPWRLQAAEALVARAVDDALDDDAPLLPYTTDWQGVPVVAERFHWVVAEAVQAAEALALATGSATHRGLADRWWSEIDEHLIDTDGSWRHELSPDLEPSARTWVGRPDAYHGVNALTCPDLGLSTVSRLLRGAPS